MQPMNQLEMKIIAGAKIAQKDYTSMSGGWWLSYGPESYITCRVADYLSKGLDLCVFIEASPKKILKERLTITRGRPAGNLGKRFDIVVWQKSSDDIKAIIEVKKAWDINLLNLDKIKITRYMEKNHFIKTGYLLVYTDIKAQSKRNGLTTRIRNWERDLKCKLVGSFLHEEENANWHWGVCLFRIDRNVLK